MNTSKLYSNIATSLYKRERFLKELERLAAKYSNFSELPTTEDDAFTKLVYLGTDWLQDKRNCEDALNNLCKANITVPENADSFKNNISITAKTLLDNLTTFDIPFESSILFGLAKKNGLNIINPKGFSSVLIFLKRNKVIVKLEKNKWMLSPNAKDLLEKLL